jgi:hypothetical protein
MYDSIDDPDNDISFYYNHSCDPTTWFALNDDSKMVAVRDIAAGEEITYDYGTSESEMTFHGGMTCMCGTARCRGIVTGNEYRNPIFVEQYFGHFSGHIQNRIDSCSYHHPHIYRRRSRECPGEYGCCAGRPIRKGEVVVVFAGKVVSTEALSLYPPIYQRYSLMVEDDLWQVPMWGRAGKEVSEYINHSCSANCAMIDSTTIIAIKDIEAGTEINFDYATVNIGISTLDADNFKCLCGSPNCRGTVSSTDYQLPEVINRYWPYFPPFVRRRIEKEGLAPAHTSYLQLPQA